MERYLYEAVISPSEQGGYDVYFPDFDIHTHGVDLTDAAVMAQDLLSLYISALLERGNAVAHTGKFRMNSPDGGIVMGIMTFVDAQSTDIETMTVDEAADILDVSRSRVYAMIRDGVLGARKVGRTQEVFARDVMDRFNHPRGAGRPRSRHMQA